MKEVIIKSKIVGKEGAIGGGKPIAFPDLSAYALRSDFIRLESSFNDFLNGDDTDNVINRWKELEAFLNNISEDYNLLSLLNGKADKATTLRGYGITDAYTKTNVDDLLKSYVTLGGTQTITGEKNFTGGLKVNGSPIYYDIDKKYWKLEGDLLVTGGVTMYGSDSSLITSTIMDAIAVDGTTISKDGGVLKVIGGTGGGVADSVAWANITGKPTWIGSSKPSYSYSEITGAISTTELQNYLTQNSYLNVTSGDNRYLQLSGGTINIESGTIFDATFGKDIFGYNPSYGVYIGYIDNDGNSYWLYSGSRDNPNPLFFKNGEFCTIWHSGNDGSGSGLDADSLDGKQPSELNVASATKLQTARTIWGQSFDGTRNASGVISGVDGISFNSSNAIDIDYNSNFVFKYTHLQDWSIQKQDTTKIFMVRNDGNVGIGTASPAYKLDVNGEFRCVSAIRIQPNDEGWADAFFNYSSTKGYLLSARGGEANKNFRLYNYTDSSYNALIDVTEYGNVGIGTINTSYKFDIASTSNSYYDLHYYNSASKASMYVGKSFYFGTQFAGTENVFQINVGVTGDGSGGHLAMNLSANGNLLVAGGITMYSDQRKKTILNHVELSLKQIADAPLIEHYYNSDEKKTTHVGSIAQYWASMNDWFCKLDSEGYYTMEIQNAALASAISVARELVKFENETNKRIRLLEEENKELRNEIERLKSA